MRTKADLKLARAWRAVQCNWWAYDSLTDACEKRPRRAWRILGVLAQVADTRMLVRDLGCGPLEDFVRMHAPRYIRQIEERALSDSRFARALKHMWLPNADDGVSRRLLALGCKPIPTKPEPWQTRTPVRPRSSKTRR